MKRIWKNLKWLFTNAPTNITNGEEEMFCEYCGKSDGGIWNYQVAEFKICQRCIKKAFDSLLS
jgi:hypothetical protein